MFNSALRGGLAERMAKLIELDKHKRKHAMNQLKTGESLTDAPLNVKVVKVKASFNHLSVAKCKLDTGEYIAVAFKHEKEHADVEVPQVVEGTKLALIPPYYSVKLHGENSDNVLMASLYMQQEYAGDDQDDMLSEELEECKRYFRIDCLYNELMFILIKHPHRLKNCLECIQRALTTTLSQSISFQSQSPNKAKCYVKMSCACLFNESF